MFLESHIVLCWFLVLEIFREKQNTPLSPPTSAVVWQLLRSPTNSTASWLASCRSKSPPSWGEKTDSSQVFHFDGTKWFKNLQSCNFCVNISDWAASTWLKIWQPKPNKDLRQFCFTFDSLPFLTFSLHSCWYLLHFWLKSLGVRQRTENLEALPTNGVPWMHQKQSGTKHPATQCKWTKCCAFTSVR